MRERVFENYEEFFTLTGPLNREQRNIILKQLSSLERKSLLRFLKSSGLEDVMTMNEVDRILDSIKEEYSHDIIELRIKILSGNNMRVEKTFWDYVISLFSNFSWQYKWNIFEGIITSDYDSRYYLLSSSRRQNGS